MTVKSVSILDWALLANCGLQDIIVAEENRQEFADAGKVFKDAKLAPEWHGVKDIWGALEHAFPATYRGGTVRSGAKQLPIEDVKPSDEVKNYA